MGIMNTYYLKKFSKEAQKKFRVKYVHLSPNYEVYGKEIITEWYPTLEQALERLKQRRRAFILSEVETHKYLKARIKYRKLNKQLAKL